MAESPTGDPAAAPTTIDDPAYARRLSVAVSGRGWRRWLDPQRPYRWNLRRLDLGLTLDLGCGIGRHLADRQPGSVGVDANPHCVETARARGLTAWTTVEFERTTPVPVASFDSLLCAHVLEHLAPDDASALLERYLPYVRPGGKVVVICPQARGQRSDPTHVTYLPPDRLTALVTAAGVEVERCSSFPLPFTAGRWFTHNETVLVGRRPRATA